MVKREKGPRGRGPWEDVQRSPERKTETPGKLWWLGLRLALTETFWRPDQR